MLTVKNVRCCGLEHPIGLDQQKVDFSWQLSSDKNDVVQKAYRIVVSDPVTGECMWDSTHRDSAAQTAIIYQGKELRSNRKYQYVVSVTDNYGEHADSTAHSFSMGIRQHEWRADWIGCRSEDLDQNIRMVSKEEMVKDFMASIAGKGFPEKAERNLEPCHIYRKEFDVKKTPEAAWLSITAHGLYEVKVNGRAITESRMNPGFTAYHKYLEFQTYDVAEYLKAGSNVITILLADGWYRGTFGILGYGNNYGLELSLLAQIELDYGKTESEFILSDESFQYVKSSVVYSDLMIGEKQDARIDTSYLDQPGADMGRAKYAEKKSYDFENLHGISCEPVACTQVLEAKEILTSPKGETIVDLGQVMVGGIRLQVQGAAGTEIKMEFTEVLDKNGCFINNVSGVNRDQTDYYILRGGDTEVFEPKFTFHGFRYVKITGYPGTLTAEKVQGIVLGSALETTGSFRCSNPMLNQLQSNIQWSQRGNMLSIPTDCPQRERAGWTGDIYIFVRTAAFNQNVRRFLDKWLRNMKQEQFEDGLIPVIIPYPLGYNAMQKDAFGTDTSAGWGDAAVRVPWILYQVYGDRSILEEHFEMMKRWMDFVEKDASEHIPELEGEVPPERLERQKYLWNTGFHFGDWCYPSCKNERGETDMFRSAHTTKEHVATAMYAHSAHLMSNICRVLGKDADAMHYEELNRNIRKAFSDEYVSEDGRIRKSVQGIYVLAIAMELAEDEKLRKMAGHLVQMIQENGNRLDTGFLSIEHLLDVLEKTGHQDTAEALLYQEKCPSWLYEVKNGATTLWETWNAIMEDGTRTRDSYNHYAFGCVGDWMYRTLSGIRCLEPGYRKFRIEPSFAYHLTEAEGCFESIYGRIRSAWTLDGKNGILKLEVPAGTRAEIRLPGLEQEVGSGSYEFTFTLQNM